MRRALIATLLCVAPPAFGYGAGVWGISGKPNPSGQTSFCNDCHSGGPPPTSVTLSGPQQIAPGEAAVYTLDVVTGASSAHVGFDVATTAGAISTVAGQPNESYIDMGDLTHTKNWPSGATVQVMFRLTAPSAPGPLTLYADALRSDGVDGPNGDQGLATTLAVTVTATAAPVNLAGVDFSGEDLASVEILDLAAVDAISSATQVQATPKPDLGPPVNEPRWACACQLARPGASGALPSLLAVGLTALFLRRRGA